MNALLLLLALLVQKPAPSSLEPNDASGAPSISDDGQLVVFESLASNFVPGDSKSTWDVFLFDRGAESVVRISDEGGLAARSPRISGDGRWIVFLQALPSRASTSPNAAPNGSEHPWKVGLHDRESGLLKWIGDARPTYELSAAPEAPTISRDGSRVVFTALEGERSVMRMLDRVKAQISTLNMGNTIKPSSANVLAPALSPDGGFLAFSSASRDLVEDHTWDRGDWFNADDHVFLRDLETRTTSIICHCASEEDGFYDFDSPRVSDGGTTVAYRYGSEHFGTAFVRFLGRSSSSLANRNVPVGSSVVAKPLGRISWLAASGESVRFESSQHGMDERSNRRRIDQVFLQKTVGDESSLVSRAADGSRGNGDSSANVASEDLSTIAFSSEATNLVAGDRNLCGDVFVYDVTKGVTSRIVPTSHVPDPPARTVALEGNDDSIAPEMSHDGELVVFASRASNFCDEDKSLTWDIFLYRSATGAVIRLSEGAARMVGRPAISGDGKWVAYWRLGRWESGADPPGWSVELHEVERGETRSIFQTWGTSPDVPPPAPSLSSSGARILFSDGRGLRVHDRESGRVNRVRCDSYDARPALSGDGRFLAYTGGQSMTNGHVGFVFVHDIDANSTRCVNDLSTATKGAGPFFRPQLSGDGRMLAFSLDRFSTRGPPNAGLVVDLVEDRQIQLTAVTERRLLLESSFVITWMSPNGRAVLVTSRGHGFLEKPLSMDQVFLHEIGSASWKPISRSQEGRDANRHAFDAVASGNLSRIAFTSDAANLVPGDNNDASDVFVVEMKSGAIRRIVPSMEGVR